MSIRLFLLTDYYFIPFTSSDFSYRRVNVNAVVLSNSIRLLIVGLIGSSFILSISAISVINTNDKDYHDITRASVAGGLKGAVDNLDSIKMITANIGETLSKSIMSGLLHHK